MYCVGGTLKACKCISGSGLVQFVSLWSVGMPEICLEGGLGKSICINPSPPCLITMVVSPILLYWWINTRVICMLVTLIAGYSKAVLAAVFLSGGNFHLKVGGGGGGGKSSGNAGDPMLGVAVFP